MASPGRMFSFRGGSHMFFIYDHRVKTEEDDPKDAILYFYPRSVKTEDQIVLVGGLIGLTDFCLEFLPQDMPQSIKLSGHNFAMLQTEEYIVGLSGSVDIPDKFLLEHMQFLWSTFVFYQGSISAIKQRCAEGEFLEELHRVWDMYLPLCQSQGDILGQSFQVLPYVQFHESQRNIFLHASHILQRSLKHRGVLAGALFNKNKVLCTQFDNTLTRTLLLLMLDSQFPGVEINSALELPGGVHLMHIFMARSDYKKLGHRRRTAFVVDDSSEASAGKSEQRLSPSLCLDHQVPQSKQSLESQSATSHGERLTPAFSSPMKRIDSDLSNRSHTKFSSPSMVQNSGTDSEVFVDTVSDLKNLRNESRLKLSDVAIDKDCSGGSGRKRDTNPPGEGTVDSGQDHQSKDELVNESSSFSASESQKKIRNSADSGNLSSTSNCDRVSEKGHQTDLRMENNGLVNEINSSANNQLKEGTINGGNGESISYNNLEKIKDKGMKTSDDNVKEVHNNYEEKNSECSSQRNETSQECNENVRLTQDENSHQENRSSASSQPVENFVYEEVDNKRKHNETDAHNQREPNTTTTSSMSQPSAITSEERSVLNSGLKAEASVSDEASQVETENSLKTENSGNTDHVSHGISAIDQQTLPARPKSLPLESPKLHKEGDDTDPHHDSCNSSHSKELIGTLHQHNQEIEESLIVKPNNSGDESSSSDLKYDENNEELMNYNQAGSLLSLATSDVARSKDRLVFERMDSENSDPGIASPMSEVGRLSPVSEMLGQSASAVPFTEPSGMENATGNVFAEEKFGDSGGFEVSNSKAADESTRSNSPWTPQEHGLEKLGLYIQGHSDTLLVLLLDKENINNPNYKGSVRDKDKCPLHDEDKGVVYNKSNSSAGDKEYLQHINSLWKSCLSHLAQLDFEVKNVERYQKDEIENLGLCYHYMHYDSFTQNLIGSAIFPVTNRANEMVDACVRMHKDFINMPDLDEATYRSHTAASYGGRSISGEVYFQIPAQGPIGGNVYWQGDKTFYLNAIAKALLKKDHNISIY